MTWNDRIVSTIRTLVPALVGAVLTWLISRVPAVGDGVAWLSETLGADVTTLLSLAAVAGVTTGYYALVRWLSPRWPWLEVLLGSKKAPAVYAAPVDAETARVVADAAGPAVAAAESVVDVVNTFSPADKEAIAAAAAAQITDRLTKP